MTPRGPSLCEVAAGWLREFVAAWIAVVREALPP